MKHIYLTIMIIVTNSLFAQDNNNRSELFLINSVLGDTLYTKSIAKRPIHIDTTELFKYLNFEKYSSFQFELWDSVPLFSDTVNSKTKKLIIDQVNQNNNFRWKNLNPKHFTIEKGNDKGSENFSLPIFYASNKIIILHSWYFSSSYTGQSADFWELKSGNWIKMKSEIIWSS